MCVILHLFGYIPRRGRSPATGHITCAVPKHSTQKASHQHSCVRALLQGDIVLKLFPDECPRTVENFTTHARNG